MAKHNGRIFRITSFLQLESRTCLLQSRTRGTEGASPSSHSPFCEEVFSRSEPDWHLPEVRFCSTNANSAFFTGSSVMLANEMDSVEYSGSWHLKELRVF